MDHGPTGTSMRGGGAASHSGFLNIHWLFCLLVLQAIISAIAVAVFLSSYFKYRYGPQYYYLHSILGVSVVWKYCATFMPSGVDSRMERSGVLIGTFESNPEGEQLSVARAKKLKIVAFVMDIIPKWDQHLRIIPPNDTRSISDLFIWESSGGTCHPIENIQWNFYMFPGQFLLVTWCSLGSIRQLLPGTAPNVSKCISADQEL